MQPHRGLVVLRRVVLQAVERPLQRLLPARRGFEIEAGAGDDAVDLLRDLPGHVVDLGLHHGDLRVLRAVARDELGAAAGQLGVLAAQIGHDRRLQNVGQRGCRAQRRRRDLLELFVAAARFRQARAGGRELVVELPHLPVGQALAAGVVQAEFRPVVLVGLLRGGDALAQLVDLLAQPLVGAAGDRGLRAALVFEIELGQRIGDPRRLGRAPATTR